jgi:hypothetical protein
MPHMRCSLCGTPRAGCARCEECERNGNYAETDRIEAEVRRIAIACELAPAGYTGPLSALSGARWGKSA